MRICTLALLALTYLASPACLAQKKAPPSKWFSLITYDSSSMEVNGKTLIRDVGEHLKGACTSGDPVERKELWEEVHKSPNIFIDLEDGPSDPNGKILSATVTVSYKTTIFSGGLSMPFSSKISEEKFFRNRNECMKERETLKKWLTEKNSEYRTSIERYK